MSLNGSVVLITGAKGGLGTYVTNAFLEAGARVAGVSRSIQDSDFTHPCFHAIPAELTSNETADGVVKAVVAKWGKVDALVHLLGAFAGGDTVENTSGETLDRMLDLNFRSAFFMIGAALREMRPKGSGRILAIGSRAATDAPATLGVYAASKAALVALVRTVAAENKDQGIAANVIMPGTMDTPANRKGMPAADFSKWVQPDQVAGLLVHLCSPNASQITGAVIPVLGAEL